jgi:hypothetical protein
MLVSSGCVTKTYVTSKMDWSGAKVGCIDDPKSKEPCTVSYKIISNTSKHESK